jgi:hypothetical protein
MVSFAIGNIAFGTATDPVPDGYGQIKVRRLQLSCGEMEAVGLPPLPSRQHDAPFSLVDRESRARWMGCWFYKWDRSTVKDGIVTIEYAVIQFETHGPILAPTGSNREQAA